MSNENKHNEPSFEDLAGYCDPNWEGEQPTQKTEANFIEPITDIVRENLIHNGMLQDEKKQKTEEERIREISLAIWKTDIWEGSYNQSMAIAKAIYTEIIEDKDKRIQELEKRESFLLDRASDLDQYSKTQQEAIDRAGNVINEKDKRIAELEKENEELNKERTTFIEGIRELVKQRDKEVANNHVLSQEIMRLESTLK